MVLRIFFSVLASILTSFGVGQAQLSAPKPVPPQVDTQAIPLYDGPAPGTENENRAEVWDDMGTERWVRNVANPTLIPVLPEEGKATGAAVIVIPGGGFQFVSIDNEGYPIAQRLADDGIAAFVLKYRPMMTPPNSVEANEYFQAMFNGTLSPEDQPDRRIGVDLAATDLERALMIVRSRADEWGIDTQRLGLLGFSAGAITAMETLVRDRTDDPAFVGYIYGPMGARDVPPDAPPLFVALAFDDPLFGTQGLGLIEAWRRANRPVEAHLYDGGGHGFGSYAKGTTSDRWQEQFVAWLRASGMLAPTQNDEM